MHWIFHFPLFYILITVKYLVIDVIHENVIIFEMQIKRADLHCIIINNYWWIFAVEIWASVVNLDLKLLIKKFSGIIV
jgi:hypothetical protein